MGKRLYILFMMLVALCAPVFCQDYDSNYYFVYITHDQTGSGNLISILEQDYERAVVEEQTWVFYLANGNNPILIEVTPEQPNKEAFDKMLELIGRNERLECFVDEDMERLMEYFNEHDFVDDDGNIKFNTVSWCMYVTPQFWNTESQFVSDLFWIFDFSTLSQINGPSFSFDVYLNMSHDELRYDGEKPFGIRNLGDINNIVGIMDYDYR